MKFITEYELKFRYQQTPFETFTLSEEMRLTPEARQFLADRHISLTMAEAKKPAGDVALQVAAAAPSSPGADTAPAPNPSAHKSLLLANYVQLDLYDTARLCKDIDVNMSQKLFATADELHTRCLQAGEAQTEQANLVAPDTFYLTYLYALSQYGPVMIRIARLGNELLLLRDDLAPQTNCLINTILQTLATLITQLKQKEPNTV